MKRYGFFCVMLLVGSFFMGNLASSAEDIRIGYVVPMTGFSARDGGNILAGAKLAIKEINGAGGVLGRNIKLFAEDDKAVPAEGVNAAVKLIERDKVHFLLKDMVSSVAFAVGEAVRKMQNPVPVMTNMCTSTKLTKVENPWFFRACQSAAMESPAFVKHWVQNLKIKRVSFLVGNDDWGKSVADECSKVLKEMGGQTVSTHFFLLTDNDFYPFLTKIKGEQPEALMVVARPEQGSKISMQFFELGMNKMMKQLGGSGHSAEDYLRLVGKDMAEGVQMIVLYDAGIPGAKNEQFVKAFQAVAGGQIPDEYSHCGYDSVYIVADAVKRAGATDPNKLRDTLEKTNYQSVVTRIAFDKNRQAHPDLFIMEYRDGKRRMLTKVSTEDIDVAK